MTLVSTRRWPWAAAVVIILIGLSFFLPLFYIHLAATMLCMVLFAISYNLILGYSGMVSFGHGMFLGIGGYVYALLATKTSVPMWLSLAAAPFVAGISAAIVGWFCTRLRGILFAMLTLAFSMMVYSLAHQWYGFTGGDDGIVGIPVPKVIASEQSYFCFVALVTMSALLVLLRLTRSPFAATLTGSRENIERMGFIGIELRRYEIVMFAISGFFSGLAGVLLSLINRQIFPAWMHWSTSAEPIIMCMLGGSGTFFGPVIGAVVMTGLKYWLPTYTIYWQLVLGIILLPLVLFFRRGISGFVMNSVMSRARK